MPYNTKEPMKYASQMPTVTRVNFPENSAFGPDSFDLAA
jgi:hypothetical protein